MGKGFKECLCTRVNLNKVKDLLKLALTRSFI